MEQPLVVMRDRASKQEIACDRNHPVAKDVWKKLERVNRINFAVEITHLPYCEWRQRFTERRRLRPIHYCIFTKNFDLHGRIYTGRYGHQNLRKMERSTIWFGGEPCVELDYSGFHTRMCYHLERIDYQGDPYALWGENTTEQLRLMAKTVINAALNAENANAAISACNLGLSLYTKEFDKDGKHIRKSGKALENAVTLQKAYYQTGIKFKQIYDLAMKHHKRIAKYFGDDSGMRLMRIDSTIALDIMFHFTDIGCVPCLGCHDSFVVPLHAEGMLRESMFNFYEMRIGFLPVVK
jgi:hypothetical protein